MFALDILGPIPPYVDTTFLDNQDVPTILVIIILMFIAYRKAKKFKPSTGLSKNSEIEENPFHFESRDILMQPKEHYNDFEIPFKNFSLRKVYILIGIVALLIFLNYVWNYEIS